MNSTIRNHLDARRLEERAASDAEVLGFWNKARQAYADALNEGPSTENRFIRLYDAGRLAAFSLVRSAGYRLKGAQGHHYVTFDVARSLVDDSRLVEAIDAMNGLRTLRHEVEYEFQDDVDAAAVESGLALVRTLLTLGAEHLRTTRPSLSAGLDSGAL